MSITWEDEPYVKAFVRDTPEFKALSYHARGLFFMLIRKVSRAGTLNVGRLGLRGVAVAVEGPWPELEAPLRELLEDGCVAYDNASGVVVVPNFMKAQETPQSDVARKRASRERARARAVDGSRTVTPSHVQSQSVPLSIDQKSREIVSRAPVREEQEECQDGGEEGSDFADFNRGAIRGRGGETEAAWRTGQSDDPGLCENGRSVADNPGDGRELPGPEGGETHAAGRGMDAGRNHNGGVTNESQVHADDDPGAPRQQGELTPGPPIAPPNDPESLLAVLERLVARGDPWAVSVERQRQERLGHLTEAQKQRLRENRDREAKAARPVVGGADEADTAAIVGAYEAARRRILGDKQYAALATDRNDARKILPDLRLLRERRKVAASLAEIVAHKLETYFRDPRNRGVNFALRWLLDRTEQDDLPKPARRVRDPTPEPSATGHASARPRHSAGRVPMTDEERVELAELKLRLANVKDGTD